MVKHLLLLWAPRPGTLGHSKPVGLLHHLLPLHFSICWKAKLHVPKTDAFGADFEGLVHVSST